MSGCRALGDETRLQILRLVIDSPRSITTAAPGGVPPLPVAVSREPVG